MTAVLSTLGLDQADLLITAQESHCTAGRTASEVSVLVGDTSLAVDTEAVATVLGVAAITQHPDYHPQVRGSANWHTGRRSTP